MTTEMFGAPFGILAAEDQINQNVLTGLKAQHALGEIGMQPAERAMKESQARYYGSLAAEHEAKARDLETMQQLETSYAAARKVADTGRTLTVEDPVPGGLSIVRSQAEAIEELAALAEGQGKVRAALPLREKASLIRQHEASTASSQAAAEKSKLEAAKDRAKRVSSFANAALANPAAYEQLKMQAAQEGFKVNVLPQQWNKDALMALRDSGILAEKQIELKEKASHDAAQEKRWKAGEAKDNASVGLAKARKDNVEERTRLIKKNGGTGTPESKAAQVELAKTRRQLREMRERKNSPPAPLDPKARVVGKVYTNAAGKKAVWQGTGWQPYVPPKEAPVSVGAADEDDDEEED